jgi:tetratricopeptide (TPR) repeat protein
VKDGAEVLERCLASVRPFVDEVAVYDTGSTDGTPELLERLGADGGPPIRVERGEWRDDFAWARDRSFDLASTGSEWLLWLDADDELAGGAELRPLVAAAEADALVALYECGHDENGWLVDQVWRVRLVRRRSGYRWHGAVHEGLFAPDGADSVLETIDPDRLRVIHRPPAVDSDPGRNLRILLAAEQHGELDERTALSLCLEFVATGQFEEAVPRLRRYLVTTGPGPTDERVDVLTQLAGCLRILGDVREAIDLDRDAAAERPDRIEPALGLAASYAALARWAEAERWAAVATDVATEGSRLRRDPRWLMLGPVLRLLEARLELGAADVDGALAVARRRAARDPSLVAALDRLDSDDIEPSLRLVRSALGRYDPNMRAIVASIRIAARQR